jgi:hypothetical protein
MLTIGARGATQVRGKDGVHPEIDWSKQFVEMNSFLARHSGRRAKNPARAEMRGQERSSDESETADSRHAPEPRHRSTKTPSQGIARSLSCISLEALAEVTAYHRAATPESFALHDA